MRHPHEDTPLPGTAERPRLGHWVRRCKSRALHAAPDVLARGSARAALRFGKRRRLHGARDLFFCGSHGRLRAKYRNVAVADAGAAFAGAAAVGDARDDVRRSEYRRSGTNRAGGARFSEWFAAFAEHAVRSAVE